MRKLPFVAIIFILFSFITRSLQIVYIDIFGPFDSIELGRQIGLRSYGILPFLFFYLPLFLIMFSIKFKNDNLVLGRFDWFCIRTVDLVGMSFLLLCFTDLLFYQTVPLFNNIDRIDFIKLTDGSVHSLLRDTAPLLTIGISVSFYLKKVIRKRYDVLSLSNLILLFFYFILTGNRFSIFYSIGTFFLFVRSFYPSEMVQHSKDIISIIRNSKALLILLFIFILFSIANNIYTSFNVIRGYEDVALAFFNRAVLENVGVYQAIYDSGINEMRIDKYLSFDAVDSSKSSAMQFLMEEISYSYDYISQIDGGQVFSGGFPEFFLYTLNYFAILFILFISVIFRYFLILMTRVEVRSNIFLFLLAFQCVFPFFLFFTSGFIDFLINPIFYVKIVLFFTFYYAYVFYNNPSL